MTLPVPYRTVTVRTVSKAKRERQLSSLWVMFLTKMLTKQRLRAYNDCRRRCGGTKFCAPCYGWLTRSPIATSGRIQVSGFLWGRARRLCVSLSLHVQSEGTGGRDWYRRDDLELVSQPVLEPPNISDTSCSLAWPRNQ